MKPIHTREWLLIIAILQLGEYQLFSSSYMFKDDQTLLNYISFASTITSLILAVIAIIYGFVQNSSSNETNARIIERIDQFKSIADEISNTTSKSEVQVDKLNTISELLYDINNSMRESTDKIVSVEEKISSIDKNNNKITEDISKLIIKEAALSDDKKSKQSKTKLSVDEINDLLRTVFRRSTTSNDVFACILQKHIQSNQKLAFGDMVSKYMIPISNAGVAEYFEYKSFFWSAYTTLKILENYELIDGFTSKDPDATIEFSEQFKRQIYILADEVRRIKIDPIQKIINIIDSV